MNRPFIIYALPRSRTTWLSAFLTYKPWVCGHDIVIDLHTIAGLKEFFAQPYTGSVETGMVEGWKVVNKLIPDAKVVVIRRKITEVNASLEKFGISVPEDIARRNALLREVSAQPGVLTVSYGDLSRQETCKAIFEHCLEIPFDQKWWESLKDKNIQIDMGERIAKLQANKDKMEALRAEVLGMAA